MINNIIGFAGLWIIIFSFIIYYVVFRTSDEELDKEDCEEDCDSEMCISNELDDIISDLASELDRYLIDRCISRAKYFGRKTADMADFNSIIYELSLDNKIISQLLAATYKREKY